MLKRMLKWILIIVSIPIVLVLLAAGFFALLAMGNSGTFF